MTDMKILVPLDGSKFAEAAIPVALGLAKSLHGQIELISVFEDEPVVATWQLSAVEMRSLLIEYLKAISQRVGEVSDISVSFGVVSGPVAKSFEDHATRSAPHVIVMSTHGRGPVSRAWLGSVADHVTRHVPMPVMLVRPEDGAEVEIADTHRFTNVLVPLDGSDRAEASLEWATRIATACEARLTLMRVVPPPLPLSSPYLPHAIANTHDALEAGQKEAAEYLREVATRLEKEGFRIPAEVVTVGVSPASGIMRHAEERAIDLIVITTHGRSGLPRLLLGSVADKVVRAAHAPVLVTRARH
jgi:nucleotide-binding universal stress UspA family protein